MSDILSLKQTLATINDYRVFVLENGPLYDIPILYDSANDSFLAVLEHPTGHKYAIVLYEGGYINRLSRGVFYQLANKAPSESEIRKATADAVKNVLTASQVVELANTGGKIQAIKQLKGMISIGLKEAKEAIEDIFPQMWD